MGFIVVIQIGLYNVDTNILIYLQPAFIKLAKIWSRLQDEVLIVANINNVYLNIDNLFRSLDLRRDVIEKMLEGHEALDDGQRLQITPELEARLEGYRKILVDPASYKDYSKLPLQVPNLKLYATEITTYDQRLFVMIQFKL